MIGTSNGLSGIYNLPESKVAFADSTGKLLNLNYTSCFNQTTGVTTFNFTSLYTIGALTLVGPNVPSTPALTL